MNNTEKLKLLRELKRREKEKIYKKDFAIFAQEQIKILPKDAVAPTGTLAPPCE